LLLETRERVAEVARKHGKFAATTGSAQNARQLIDMGYQFISIGADVVGLSNYCNQIIDDFNESVRHIYN
jgi:4-hydroxy-2-oxoheptanedioate aldolase